MQTVRKIFNIWKKKELMTEEVFEEALTALDKKENEAQLEALSSRERGIEEWEKEKIRRKKRKADEDPRTIIMETHRRLAKEQKYEQVLRPKGEGKYGECDELYQHPMSDEDLRRLIPNYDHKMANFYLYGLPAAPIGFPMEDLSKLIPSSSVSPFSPSPSPSEMTPSTPYSPSRSVPTPMRHAPLKNGNAAPGAYSPTDPTSSPECPANSKTASPPHRPSYVFVWNIDDALTILNSLISGKYCRHNNIDPNQGRSLGERIQRVIRDISLDAFFFRDHEDVGHPSLNAMNSYDDGKDIKDSDLSQFSKNRDNRWLAYRYRRVKELYEGKLDLRRHVDSKVLKEMDKLLDEMDSFTNGWARVSENLLKATTKIPDVENILVSSKHIITTVVELVMFKLHGLVKPENICSMMQAGRIACLKQIREKHPGSKFIAIGSGEHKSEVIQQLGWPYICVDGISDLASFHASLLRGVDALFEQNST
eukprot:TRINITY_DN586_c0_g1_i2.p1 TRINITY_DN586_c0_g1~~TRINITY_DN586_c0_g1_i2.p1  ORF type:complete len:479 (+),score=104.44 TRINITY_DN586_c0_g1_i2:679-2115(+)